MNYIPILQLLDAYFATNDSEVKERFEKFIDSHPDCFERSCLVGHITGSAWVIDSTRSYALLTHHRKLDRWLQFGGHCDGDPDVFASAYREGLEESGLQQLKPLSNDIFDVDIHLIPERGNEPYHYHYDVRFLFEGDMSEPLVVSKESKALSWLRIDEIENYNKEPSVLRMVDKTLENKDSA